MRTAAARILLVMLSSVSAILGQGRERFLLYDIPAAEGFNLRRDVLTRALLLTEDLGRDWTLVLPPFHRMVQWRTDAPGETVPWREFLDLSGLRDRVRVIEFDDYAAAHGRRVDQLLHLVSGPLDDKGARIEPRPCAAGAVPARFFGNTTAIAAAASGCRFMLAPYAMLAATLRDLPGSSVLVNDFQIGYWDGTYGSARYWAMRERVRFSPALLDVADRFQRGAFAATPFLAVHLRRGDFLATPRPHPSLDDVIAQVNAAMTRTGLTRVYLATDGSPEDLAYLRQRMSFDRFVPAKDAGISDGGVAIVDQIIASRAAHFIGTAESTFSTVIMQDREIAGREPASTYNVLCKTAAPCPVPARFPRPRPN
jgi:peptide-O-fucosyltransferase